MKLGEKIIFGVSALLLVIGLIFSYSVMKNPIPVSFVVDDTPESQRGSVVFRREGCKNCHMILGNGNAKGPDLDGMGHRRDRVWLEVYLSSENPQAILPSKPDTNPYYKMPSWSKLTKQDRDDLISFLLAQKSKDPGYDYYYTGKTE